MMTTEQLVKAIQQAHEDWAARIAVLETAREAAEQLAGSFADGGTRRTIRIRTTARRSAAALAELIEALEVRS